MSEIISADMADVSGEAGPFKVFFRSEAGVLLNPGGDVLVETLDGGGAPTGIFTTTLTEARAAYLRARIYEGTTETTANILYNSFLAVGETEIGVEPPVDIGSALSSAVSGLLLEIGTIVGFPSELQIDDSYLAESGSAITVYLRDADDNPVTDVGDHSILDEDFVPIITIKNKTLVTAEVALVTPPGEEAYLLVEIPAEQTRRAVAGEATMQCVLTWGKVKRTIATQSVEWLPRL